MKLRLSPPLLEVSPELLWVLSRALAPAGAWTSPPVDPRQAWRLARALDMACRIGWRVPRSQLVTEVGEEIANRFASAYHDAAASAMVINAVAVEVAERLYRAGVAAVLLKSNALVLAGFTQVGARRFTDVDVLVPGDQAQQARALLQADGYSCADRWDGAHQLSSLYHPSRVMVEIHTRVKHMRLARGGGWARFEDLQRAGHLRPLAHPAGAMVPAPAFLAGHALIHGLVHHWRQVGDYPLMRLLGDLDDLSMHWRDESPLAEAVQPWLAAERVEAEGRAVLEVGDLLAPGGDAAGFGRSDRLGDNLFLRHVLASQFDRAYQDAVRAVAIFWVDNNRSWTGALARKVRNRLFLADASMARRYGRGRGRGRQALLRLLRPGELLFKSIVLLARYATYRWRGSEKRSIRVGGSAGSVS